MTGYPVSLNGRTTKKESNLEIVKDRYGKPVLTPIWGTDVTESRCIDVVKPPMMTAAEGYTPRRRSLKQVGPMKWTITGLNNRCSTRCEGLI